MADDSFFSIIKKREGVFEVYPLKYDTICRGWNVKWFFEVCEKVDWLACIDICTRECALHVVSVGFLCIELRRASCTRGSVVESVDVRDE